MGTKQVRLSEDVYAKIEDKKQPDESFSDAIDRLTSDWSLAGWAGWMSDADAERHRERVSELEAADRRETEALADDLGIDPE
jgi:predicted CopG family antitoxin